LVLLLQRHVDIKLSKIILFYHTQFTSLRTCNVIARNNIIAVAHSESLRVGCVIFILNFKRNNMRTDRRELKNILLSAHIYVGTL